MSARSRLARRVHFSSGHRYFNPEMTETENKETFGSCYSEHGHGHNYILEAFFEGPIDKKTGMVINLIEVDEILKSVVAPLDHHHLNFDVPYFKEKVPTTENIAEYCFNQISERVKAPHVSLYKVRLFEGRDLWVDYVKTETKDS